MDDSMNIDMDTTSRSQSPVSSLPYTPSPSPPPILFDEDYDKWRQPLETAIYTDDAPAMRDLLEQYPTLFDYEHHASRGEYDAPLITRVARLGSNAVLAVLLDHRDAMDVPVALNAVNKNKLGRWGTPLTEACRYAHVETVRLLLDRMPDTDINEVDSEGMTPLLAVTNRSFGPIPDWAPEPWERPPWRNPLLETEETEGWVEVEIETPFHQTTTDEYNEDQRAESLRRVELILLLFERGTDPQMQQRPYNNEELPEVWIWRWSMQAIDRELANRGGSALSLASGGDVAVLRALLEGGVDIHQTHHAEVSRLDNTGTHNRSVDTVRILHRVINKPCSRYSRGDTDWADLSPLGVAAMYHSVCGIEALLKVAVEAGIDMMGDLVPSSETMLSPLHAAITGQPHVCSWGIVEDNHNDLYPDEAVHLHTCSMLYAAKTVELLTSDIAVCAATLNATFVDDAGRAFAPLHTAARFDRLPLLRVLLDRGADPSVRMPTNGHTVLLAVFVSLPVLTSKRLTSERRLTIGPVSELMEAAEVALDMDRLVGDLLRGFGEDEDAVNEADEDGNTALHWAMAYGLERSAEALIAHGARLDKENDAGEVPLWWRMPTVKQPYW